MPIRIQRRRTKGWRAPAEAVYVGRPTRFANPARVVYRKNTGGWHVEHGNGGNVGVWPDPAGARRFAVEVYRSWITQPEQEPTRALFRALLHGRDLVCWCPLPEPGQPDHCHAAVLLDLANRPT